MVDFYRQIGANQVGVQLNGVLDETGNGVNTGVWDQVVAVPMRTTRGRIDRAFSTAASGTALAAKVGKVPGMNTQALSEAMVIANEAGRRGARGLVVSRLVPLADAVVKWLIFTSAATSTFTVSATAPIGSYTAGVKHLGCYNDGIKLEVHADALPDDAANEFVHVIIRDVDGNELYSLRGSFDPDGVDSSGNSTYIPDVSERLFGDELEWSIHASASIESTHDGYGKSVDGAKKWAASGVKIAFEEGGTTYLSTDYTDALNRLRDTSLPFGYLITAGSRSVPLVQGLIDLGYTVNRPVVVDVPGELGHRAAIAWVQQFSVGTPSQDYFPWFIWAPVKAQNMVNNGMNIYGASGVVAGYAGARNATRNAYGYASKNRPIAGKDYPLGRTQARLVATLPAGYTWDEVREDLAAANIIQVLPEVYSDGTYMVFVDCLNAANTNTSVRKLTTVTEMLADLQHRIVWLDKETRFLPQAEKRRAIETGLTSILKGAQGSGWLVTGADSEGKTIPPYEFTVSTQRVDEVDTVHVDVALHFAGVNRRTFITTRLR